MHKDLFITAIDTDSGKTLISALLLEALGYNYWKPVQAGQPTDTNSIRLLRPDAITTYFPEAYLLEHPMSPHAAAKRENREVKLESVKRPDSNKPLIIEGAGGLLVPLNDTDFVADIPASLNIPVVLVSNLYLGNINHTLLSLEVARSRKLNLIGIIFNGESNPESEQIILRHTEVPCLFKLPKLKELNPEVVKLWGGKLRSSLNGNPVFGFYS